MQWWIEQANDYRVALTGLGITHRLEDAHKVRSLKWEELIQRFLPFLDGRREDHLLYNREPFLLHEHMLSAAQSDALRAKGDGALCVAWIVGIGPDAQAT